MALIKEVVSFMLLLIVSRFFVYGGRIINPSEFGSIDERRSGEQKNFAAPTTWQDPNFAPEYRPCEISQYQERPPVRTTARTTTTSTTTERSTARITTKKLGLDTRNNFGDLPVKCGPNQERIHGECRDV